MFVLVTGMNAIFLFFQGFTFTFQEPVGNNLCKSLENMNELMCEISAKDCNAQGLRILVKVQYTLYLLSEI